MIKAIIFDCFGVLYVDPGQYFFEHYVPQFASLQPQLTDLLAAVDRGFISQADFNSQVAELTGLSVDFVNNNIHSVHQRNHNLLDFAQKLRSDYGLGMLSNIGRGEMDSFFNQTERQELFDEVVLSSEVGLIKPQPEIFELIAQRLAVDTSQCLMVDDVAANVAGAERAGMKGVVYQNNQQTEADIQRILKGESA